MNAPFQTRDPSVVVTRISDSAWVVVIDGRIARKVTQVGSCFIAWIGRDDWHWCFQKAIDACAEDARHQVIESRRVVKDGETTVEAFVEGEYRLLHLHQFNRLKAGATLADLGLAPPTTEE